MPKEIEDENSINADDILDDVKVKLQSAIANMSPKKFEQFSRALLTKMGFPEKWEKIMCYKKQLHDVQ